jgi:hypothetical protein
MLLKISVSNCNCFCSYWSLFDQYILFFIEYNLKVVHLKFSIFEILFARSNKAKPWLIFVNYTYSCAIKTNSSKKIFVNKPAFITHHKNKLIISRLSIKIFFLSICSCDLSLSVWVEYKCNKQQDSEYFIFCAPHFILFSLASTTWNSISSRP